MKKLIAVFACVVVVDDDEQEGAVQGLPTRNPLDDLVERIRREGPYADDTVNWRYADGPKVA